MNILSKLKSIFYVLVLSLSLTFSNVYAQENLEQKYASGQILIKPKSGVSEAELSDILIQNNSNKGKRLGNTEIRLINIPKGLEKQTVEKLSKHPKIEFAELDLLLPSILAVNDPYLGSQYHIPKIQAPTAWDTTLGQGVTIAILDSGVDSNHPDLASRIVPGWNFYDNNSNTSDVFGHGTLVAGAAAASSNNSIGVAGVAGSAKIMPIRITDLSGYGLFSAMAQAVIYAADNSVKVVNLSFGAGGSFSVQSAGNYLKSKGGLLFISAGNYSTEEISEPSDSVIVVSATDSSDRKTSWSSYGQFVDLSAPGAGIWTTVRGGGYSSANGTSFSAPITAGVAALVLSANPRLNSNQVQDILFQSSVDLGTVGKDIYFGHGRVNAASAVQLALTTTGLLDTEVPTVSIQSPTSGSTVSGTVQISVVATDNTQVKEVQLFVNSSRVMTSSVSPFTFNWNSTSVQNSTVTLGVVAVDSSGNQSAVSSISVNVSNPVTPRKGNRGKNR